MRCWGIASSILLAVSTTVAGADTPPPAAGGVATAGGDVGKPAETKPAPDANLFLGYAAMPGGLRAPSADTLPGKMFAVSLIGGFGLRNKVLGPDHKMSRGIGDVAFAFAPTDMLTLGLTFDGRFDKHTGGVTAGGDDGLVGDPRFIARFGAKSGGITAGAQLMLLVPGKDAPSVDFNAVAVDVRGLLTIAAGPGKLSLDAGFRLDKSSKSVVDKDGNDNRTQLSAEDRISLGVSDFNAMVAGVHYVLPAGSKAYVGFEGSMDLFFGTYNGRMGDATLPDIPAHDAPGAILRAGANGGIKLAPQWTAYAFIQLAKVPKPSGSDVTAGNIALIPYEPSFTGGIGITAHFGGPKVVGPSGNKIVDNVVKNPVIVVEEAEIQGTVTDDSGKPLAGAKVTIKNKNKSTSGVTDQNGKFDLKGLPIGKTVDGKTDLDDTGAEVIVEGIEGKKQKLPVTMTLAKGNNAVATIVLDPILPPGQFKAVVRASGTGKPLAGITVKLEPGGASAVTDDQGNVSIDLQPGTYKATASGTGWAAQTLDAVIEQSQVNVRQFELQKK